MDELSYKDEWKKSNTKVYSIVIKHKNSQSQSMEAEVKIEVTLGTADR